MKDLLPYVYVTSAEATAMQKAIASFNCDGTADQVQIQSAIDSLPESGGAVLLSQGTFYKNNAAGITLESNVQILMQPNTIIQLTANPGNDPVVFSADTKSNILIRGGIIDGKKALQTTITGTDAMGISFTAVTNSWIDQVTIKDFGTSVALSGRGIYFAGSSYNRVTNCLLSGNKRQNLVLYSASDYNVIAGNIADASDDRNFVCHTASSNIFKGNISKNSVGQGFQLTITSVRNIIVGNNVYNSTLAGIEVTTDSPNNLIIGNTVQANLQHGIYLRGAQSSAVGNFCIDNGGAGIAIESTGTYNLIQGNFLQNNGSLMAGAEQGIFCYGDYNAILSNTFENGTHQDYCIRFVAGGDSNYCANNDLRYGGVIAPILNGGASNIIIHNAGWITESQGTSTGTGAQQTIAHGLSATPTHVFLSDWDALAVPYQSAAANSTNIYITALNAKKYTWHCLVR